MTSGGGVFVSAEKIYDEVLALNKSFGDVKALLEQHIALEEQRSEGVETRLENHGTRLGDHGTRLTKAETDIAALQETAEKKEKGKAPWWAYPALAYALIQIIASTGNFVRDLNFTP